MATSGLGMTCDTEATELTVGFGLEEPSLGLPGIQWLGRCASTTGSVGSVPGQET